MAQQKKLKQEDIDQLAREFTTLLHEFTYQSKDPVDRHEDRVAFIERLVRVARGESLGGE